MSGDKIHKILYTLKYRSISRVFYEYRSLISKELMVNGQSLSKVCYGLLRTCVVLWSEIKPKH
jgi:hypothetical protein